MPAVQCYLAYLSALFLGATTWWMLENSGRLEGPFEIGLAVTCAATVVIWIYSIANGNSSIYDPYWVIAPPFLVLLIRASGEGDGVTDWSARQLGVAAGFVLWGVRYHTMYAWTGWRTGLVHEDWRYEAMRGAPVPYWLNSLVGMHLFPTLLVYFAFAPAALVLMADPARQPALGMWDAIGFVGVLAAVAIELVADEQLRRYRESPDYAGGGACRVGLWRYSRHPNYFGEVLFWLSMIPFAISDGTAARQPVLVWTGPIVMALFFRFSAWLMDVRSLERRPDYRVVMDEVSALVPWPPKQA